jgi:hypothetical protein
MNYSGKKKQGLLRKLENQLHFIFLHIHITQNSIRFYGT